MNNIDNGIMKPVGRTDPHSYDKVGVRSEPETLETFLAQRMLRNTLLYHILANEFL